MGLLCSGLASLHTMHEPFRQLYTVDMYVHAKPQQGSSNKACLGHMHLLLCACMYVRIEACGRRPLQAALMLLHMLVCIYTLLQVIGSGHAKVIK